MSTHRLLMLTFAATTAALVLDPSTAEAATRRAFVTSTVGSGNLASWPGVSGATAHDRADSICRAHATLADLPNPTTYHAWLSTSTTDAYCHVQGLTGKKATGCGGAALPGAGPWHLVNGVTPFAGELDVLVDRGKIYRPVALDEHGDEDAVAREIWTGTNADGVGSSGHCADWTSSSSAVSGMSGRSGSSAIRWTQWGSLPCAEHNRLLCLEPGAGSTTGVPTSWQPSAIAFVSSARGNGDLSSWSQAQGEAGLAAGDAICRTLAADAGLPGAEAFVAWLSDGGSDVRDRLTIAARFKRPDYFTFANSRTDLLDGHAATSLHVNERGKYVQIDDPVFTGSEADGTAWGSDCAGWTSSDAADHGRQAFAGSARSPIWTDGGSRGCNQLSRIYCFQNQVTTTLALFEDGFESGSTSAWSAAQP